MGTLTISLVAFCLILMSGISDAESFTDPGKDTELVFTFIVHRHGDKTPEKRENLKRINMDKEDLRNLINNWGYGELTNVGIETAYHTGEFIRRRYDGFISSKYNPAEIFVRSDNYTRTKMTARAATAAIFGSPVPMPTPPSNDQDYQLPVFDSCKKFKKIFADLKKEKAPSALKKYQHVLTQLANIIGNKKVIDMPGEVLGVGETLSCLVSLNYDLGAELTQLYPKFLPAFDESWEFIFGREDVVTLSSALLLNAFFENADKIINGKATQKMRVYSGHDSNVYTLQAATGVIPQGDPKFGSLYSLELRKLPSTGQYVVLPVYFTGPEIGDVRYLQVRDCGVLCEYNKFKSITARHRLDEEELKKKCNA
ncbi:histidine phosphatase superfamily (branch 2) domain-containing protein [Phthorimaea operculella]|nr:histidine phosphatase superfamily (branch 2) domain-containing protein [Phthorimaea operculella]